MIAPCVDDAGSSCVVMRDRYCTQCGNATRIETPKGDHRERAVCARCGWVSYENPRMLIACLATSENKLLWMRRRTNPMKGFWFVPTGYVEEGETPEQAAARELAEETRAVVDPDQLELYLVLSLSALGELYLVYRGELICTNARPTPEAAEVELLGADEVPWEHLAYPQMSDVFAQFYAEHASKQYGIYEAKFSEHGRRCRCIGVSYQ